MTSLPRFLVVLAGVTILAIACGGDAPTGPAAASVTGIAGDSQVAGTGGRLAFPLSFIVLGSSGQPLQGVRVTWAVVSPVGGATFAPATSTSDAQGTAATTVTLGGTIGDVVIRGNVSGLAPVVFHARAVDPCTYAAPYTLGATVSAALGTFDCNLFLNGFYYDFYRLDLPPGGGQQSLRITMSSAAFDTWVTLFRFSDGAFVAFDDDVDMTVITNSQLDIILPEASYVIGPSSFGAGVTGPYTMAAATRSANMNGCRAVWLLRGVTVSDAIANTDCADSVAGTDHYYDVARFWLTVGTVLTIAERSTEVNAKLTLYQVDPNQLDANLQYPRTLVATNDDSTAGNPNSFIAYSVPATGLYDVLIGTSTPGDVGPYTFDVSASTSLSPAAPGEARGWRWRPGAAPIFRP
jgi:hypothetical protein